MGRTAHQSKSGMKELNPKPGGATISRGCSNSFKKFGMEHGDWKRKSRTPIKKRATERRKQETIYIRLAAQLIKEAREAGQTCPVMKAIFDATAQVDQVHHMAGREGKLLTMKEHLLPVSWLGHEWIHQNPNEAREHGWLYEVRREGNQWVKTNK